MNIENTTRPYDDALAAAGNPVGCQDVRYTANIWKRTDSAIFGSVIGSAEEFPASWSRTTGMLRGFNTPGPHDLVLIPGSICQGRGVYLCDTLFDEGGNQFEVDVSDLMRLDFISTCTWGKVEKLQTRMTDLELSQAEGFPGQEGLRNVANVAIARAIADGDVVPVKKDEGSGKNLG